MTVSAAKLEANRHNAMMSCGPRTESGKQRSKLNAVKHGMRAATLVLLDEDPEALEDRRADWAASLMPRGAAEQRIVDDAVEYSWLRDRARQAQEARLAANIVNAGIDEANHEADEVLRLGQLLFSDNRGPLARITTGKRTGTLSACRWFPIPRLSTAIPKTPSAWFFTCKRRPAAASGCSTAGPSSGRFSRKDWIGSRPTSSRPSGCWVAIPSRRSTIGMSSWFSSPVR
jgi:hypothetical protein